MLNTVSAKAAKDTPLSYKIDHYYVTIPPACTDFFISLPTYFLVTTISHLALEDQRGGIIQYLGLSNKGPTAPTTA
uniref:Uncharacterized protein n=1 Tax=Utricularia reniformis TaxID=192314 RepID=A0A1Y0AYZ0_9LAMI|nr:hypothetical protein AEK19_MT1452 [Utricularia reniformis]ART30382.1 hypothetical protein AEK19_MT1452 [Utricularia reniformis]